MNTKQITAWLSIIVATIALVLSQFPPIISYLDEPEFELIAYKNVHIRHHFGEISLAPFIQIENSGNARGKISKLELILTNTAGDSFKKKLIAQQYYPKPGAVAPYQLSPTIPFGHISIQSKETWEAYVDFFVTPDIPKRDKVVDFEERMISEIQSKEQGVSPNFKFDYSEPKISDELFDEIKAFTDQKISSFVIGVYTLHLKLYDEGNTDVVAQKCYSLSVHGGQLKLLNKITDMYRNGEGIIYPPIGRVGFIANLFDATCPA